MRKMRELRLARGWTRKRAATECDISFGMFHKLERGERRLSLANLDKLAKGFGVEPKDMVAITGAAPATRDDEIPDILRSLGKFVEAGGNATVTDGNLVRFARALIEASKLAPSTVPVHGVAQDLEGAVAWTPSAGVAPAPIGATPATAALEIRGGVIRGLATDGWFLYFDDLRRPLDGAALGELSVVATASGEVFLRTPRAGSAPGRFHLESAGAATMYDVEVTWAAIVTSIIPGRIAQRMLAGEDLGPVQSAPYKADRGDK